MKRHLLLTFLLLVVGLLPAVATETLELDFTPNTNKQGFPSSAVSSGSVVKTFTAGDYNVTIEFFQNSWWAKNSSNSYIATKKAAPAGYIYLYPIEGKKITAVNLYLPSGVTNKSKFDISSVDSGENIGSFSWSAAGSWSSTVAIPEADQTKKLKIITTNTGNQCGFGKIELTLEDDVATEAPEAPVFDPAGGKVLSGTTVQISSKGADKIYYSFDGETYTEGSEATITETCTLYAKGENAIGESEVSSAEYEVIPGGTVTFAYKSVYNYSADKTALDWVSDDGKWTFPTSVTVEGSTYPSVVTAANGLRINDKYNQIITVNAPVGYRFESISYKVANKSYDIAIDNEQPIDQTRTFDEPKKSFEISSATSGYTDLTYMTMVLVEYPEDLVLGEPVFSVTDEEVEYGTEVTVKAENAKYMTYVIEFDDKEPDSGEVFGDSFTFKVEYDCLVTVTAGPSEDEAAATENYAMYQIIRPAAPVFTPEDGTTVVMGTEVKFSSPGHKYGYLLTTLGADEDVTEAPVDGPEGSYIVNDEVVLSVCAVLPNGYKGESAEACYLVTYPACATPTMAPDTTVFKAGETITISCATEGSTMLVSINGEIIDCESSQFTYTFGNEGTYEIEAVASAPRHTDSEEFKATVTVLPNLPEFYLRGSMTGSDWPALPEFKFALESYDKTDNGEYVYTLAMPVTLNNGDQFKVSNDDWSINFGGVSNNDPERTFYASDDEKTREGVRNGDNYLVNGNIFRPTVYLYYKPSGWESSWVRVVRGTVPGVSVDVESGSAVKSGSTVNVTLPGATEIIVAEKSITGHDVAPMTFEGEMAELPVSRLHRNYTVKGVIDGFETEAVELVYDILAAPKATTYELVTSANQLQDGMTVVIGAGFKGNVEYTQYLMGQQKTNNFGYVELDDYVLSGVITDLPEGVPTVTLVAAGDKWGLQLENGSFLKPRTGNNNGLQTQSDLCPATIEFDEDGSGDITVTFPSSFARNVLQFNTSSNPLLFACYGSAQYASIRLYAEKQGEAGGVDNAPAMHVYLTRHTEAETGGDDDDPVLEAGEIDGGTEANQLEAVSTDEDGTITFKSTIGGNYTGKFHYTVSDPETGEETVIGGHPDEVVDFHSDENGTCTEDHADHTKYVFVDPAEDSAPVTMVADSNVPFSLDPNSAHGMTTKAVNPEFTVSMKPFEAVTTMAVGGAGTTAVANVGIDRNDGAVEFFNLNGVRLDGSSLAPGVYIRRQGSEVTKVVVK